MLKVNFNFKIVRIIKFLINTQFISIYSGSAQFFTIYHILISSSVLGMLDHIKEGKVYQSILFMFLEETTLSEKLIRILFLEIEI